LGSKNFHTWWVSTHHHHYYYYFIFNEKRKRKLYIYLSNFHQIYNVPHKLQKVAMSPTNLRNPFIYPPLLGFSKPRFAWTFFDTNELTLMYVLLWNVWKYNYAITVKIKIKIAGHGGDSQPVRGSCNSFFFFFFFFFGVFFLFIFYLKRYYYHFKPSFSMWFNEKS
jgi:hypothetical protein